MQSKINYLNSLQSAFPKRVLVVDDDRDTAEAIKFLIERHGTAICEISSDPYEALLALSDEDYDFVFVDQKMPGLKGSNFLSQIDEFVDQDPLIVEAGRYSELTPAVLMSGSDIQLNDNYKLKHFDLLKVIHKNDLATFLSEKFAS